MQHTATLYRATSMFRSHFPASYCNTLQHAATHCNTLQHTATHYRVPNKLRRCYFASHFLPMSPVGKAHLAGIDMQDNGDETFSRRLSAATHCNTLQHTATLQATATYYKTMQHTTTPCNTLQQIATHCNTLQHTAAYYKTMQHTTTPCNTLQHTATHQVLCRK